MNDAPAQSLSPEHLEAPLQLVCTEVWGGNRPIDAPVELPGVRGRIYSRPCDGGRGGDIHYLSVCSSGLLSRFVLADVMGHGEAVATVSTAIHGLLQRYMNWPDQRRILAKLNQHLVEIGFTALTTAAAFTYLPPWRRLSVSYAGHPPAYWYRPQRGSWEPLAAEGRGARRGRLRDLPLAAEAETLFDQKAVRVEYGDRLLVLTDGVLEVSSPSGERFGTGRLGDLLQANRQLPIDRLVESVVQALVSYSGDAGLTHDDVTFLLVEFVPGPPGPALWHAVKNRLRRPRGNSADPAFGLPSG